MNELRVENLRVAVGDQEIVRGLTLRVPQGEVHALMGPNGSGKSTLAKVLAGHPDYRVIAGKILMDGENLLELDPDERARRGGARCQGNPGAGGGTVWHAGFLPAEHQGIVFDNSEIEPEKMIPFLRNKQLEAKPQRRDLDVLQVLNRDHNESFGTDEFLEGRIKAMEAAYRMQFEASDVFDVRREPVRHGDRRRGGGYELAAVVE
jgi:Fe-S cluster assembly ATPase SufC